MTRVAGSDAGGYPRSTGAITDSTNLIVLSSLTATDRQSLSLPCDLFEVAFMKLSSRIRPISYLKAHAAEIVRTLAAQGEPLIITQNGEAKAVVQDIRSYEQTQETLALLKILALGSRQVEAGQVQPAAEVIARLRERQRSR